MYYKDYIEELKKKEEELKDLKSELYKKLEKLWESTLKDEEFLNMLKDSRNRYCNLKGGNYELQIMDFEMDKEGINFWIRKGPTDVYSTLPHIDLLKIKIKNEELFLNILLKECRTEDILDLYIDSKYGIKKIKENACFRLEYEIEIKENLISKINKVDEEEKTTIKNLTVKTNTESFSYRLEKDDIRYFMEDLENSNTFINLPEKDRCIVLNKKEILEILIIG